MPELTRENWLSAKLTPRVIEVFTHQFYAVWIYSFSFLTGISSVKSLGFSSNNSFSKESACNLRCSAKAFLSISLGAKNLVVSLFAAIPPPLASSKPRQIHWFLSAFNNAFLHVLFRGCNCILAIIFLQFFCHF